MVRQEFRRRLVRASEGNLEPIDEVKPVDVDNPPPLFEIRWQGVAVTDAMEDGTLKFGEVVVRLYHSEPDRFPGYFIGHHAHEKDLGVEDINAAQDAEIATAVGWYYHGDPTDWGIAPDAPDNIDSSL